MKRFAISCWLLAVGSWSVARAEGELPRNPFWPQDYEGTRYAISAVPRFKPKPPEPVETNIVKKSAIQQSPSQKTDLTEDPVWNEAVKSLHFGSTLGFCANGKSQAAVLINDRVYAVGDLVSANFTGRRFTWKIESLSTDGKIKLKRITYRKIETNP